MIKYYEKNTRVGSINSRVEDSAAPDLIDDSLMKNTGVCPECSCTVMRSYHAIDTWTCHRCKKSFCEEDLVKE